MDLKLIQEATVAVIPDNPQVVDDGDGYGRVLEPTSGIVYAFTGIPASLGIKTGSVVLFRHGVGEGVIFENKKYLILHITDILAVVT